ncbi:MAG: helix-hairpin-helix domain-containing protein [Syntrophales bacterium]|nr:helix-hairpin-helix domain-containing protein [Syntrophales bacterium]
MNETVTKKDVIAILKDIGKLLELKGATPFKSLEYYSAARNIAATEEDINNALIPFVGARKMFIFYSLAVQFRG